MKYVLLAGMLSLTFACDNSATPDETTVTDQDLTPGSEVATEPNTADAALTEEGENDFTSHFDAAVATFDQSHYAEAADHLQMATAALESEQVELEGEAQESLKAVIEEIENLTDRVRAGEVSDRSEITTLIQRAQEAVYPTEE
ncbi:hypothetical protein [Lewinella sp. JB7]|uniref:hypothetical protein n=1 Tax=Lewinella sp. JB7 TaxID=2962887 RepID=UPI0020C9EFBA|nr:hypothetical protein [Lewinella sp. JB7]MCP9236191.1 hypothetical protein [Lewinella sp. JB7]